MKNNKELDKIHPIDKRSKPKDFDEIKHDLISETHREIAEINIGVNRGQLFIRIPSRITKVLDLTKENKIKLIAEINKKEKKLNIEIIK